MRFCRFVLILMLLGPAAAVQALVPNDPNYNNLWYAQRMGLPAAWDYSMGSAVTIAVLDTGVMANTPDLSGRVLPALSATGSPALDGTANHHGTWVSSVAAGGVNNGIGGAGVGNFNVLPITITRADGTSETSWIANGVRMAADAGAKVINIAYRPFSYGVIDEAAAYARSKGALTFVSAGNWNHQSLMTGLDNLIFVAGTDVNDGRWVNSSTVGSTYGPFVDICAPADDVLVADGTSGYLLADGTSFSSPLASGAAALAWSINPLLSPDALLTMMYTTADDLGPVGWDEEFGWGRINFGQLAEAAAASVPEPQLVGWMALAGLLGLRRR